jgi:hypothetical protein
MRRPLVPPRFALCFVCTLVTAAMALALVARSGWLTA